MRKTTSRFSIGAAIILGFVLWLGGVASCLLIADARFESAPESFLPYLGTGVGYEIAMKTDADFRKELVKLAKGSALVGFRMGAQYRECMEKTGQDCKGLDYIYDKIDETANNTTFEKMP